MANHTSTSNCPDASLSLPPGQGHQFHCGREGAEDTGGLMIQSSHHLPTPTHGPNLTDTGGIGADLYWGQQQC